MKWQPIETVPDEYKITEWNQPRILAVFNGKVQIASWDDERYHKKPRPFWRYDWNNVGSQREIQPTHWTPLPEPPK